MPGSMVVQAFWNPIRGALWFLSSSGFPTSTRHHLQYPIRWQYNYTLYTGGGSRSLLIPTTTRSTLPPGISAIFNQSKDWQKLASSKIWFILILNKTISEHLQRRAESTLIHSLFSREEPSEPALAPIGELRCMAVTMMMKIITRIMVMTMVKINSPSYVLCHNCQEKRRYTKPLQKERAVNPPPPPQLRWLLRVQAENFVFSSCNLSHRSAISLCSLDNLTRPKKSSY